MLVLLGSIIYLSFTAEAMTGFGSIVIAVTLGSLLFDIKELLPVLAALNLILGSYIFLRYRRHIDLVLLVKFILPMMLAGAVGGFIIYKFSPGDILKQVFGALVIIFSIREIARRVLRRSEEIEPHNRLIASFWMFLAGITHGLYASGGPLLVYALAGLKRVKAVFRATLSMVWLVMNLFLTVVYASTGETTAREAYRILIFAPVVPLAIMTGEFLHHKVNEKAFQLVVFTLLLAAGVALLL